MECGDAAAVPAAPPGLGPGNLAASARPLGRGAGSLARRGLMRRGETLSGADTLDSGHGIIRITRNDQIVLSNWKIVYQD